MIKFIKIIVLIGIFIIPLINSRITNLLGFSFSMPVNGNFEFTKVMFFNIWSSVVIGLFFVNNIISRVGMHSSQKAKNIVKEEQKLLFPMALLVFYIILILSTYFSISPYISFFGNEIKSHSFIMWSNLVGLFVVFSSILSRKFFKQIIITLILSGIFVSIIGLKEYFSPTFDYGDLGNRLFSTFGHPNYVSIFLVSLMPFLYGHLSQSTSKIKRIAQFFIVLLFGTALLFTKSVFAIFLFFCFNVWFFYSQFTTSFLLPKRKQFKIGMLMFVIVIVSSTLFKFFPEKLHSFVSRYFIWETAIKVIFSDIKIFLLGGGAETFTYFFDNYKSEYLYIFENLGFSADRPHNIILNFFYHFGIGGLSFILAIYYYIFKSIYSGGTQSINPTNISVIIILLFLLLNPTSIVIYLLVIILLTHLFLENRKELPLALVKSKNSGKRYYWLSSLFGIITLISLYGAYSSFNFYYSEIKVYNSQLSQAINIYKFNPNNYLYNGELGEGLTYSKIKTPEYYYVKIQVTDNKEEICDKFTKKYNFSESYFFCGNYFWNIGNKSLAKYYYRSGLKLLPDLWNNESEYYDNFLVKKLKINGNRFLSKKYGLAQILERVGMINE